MDLEVQTTVNDYSTVEAREVERWRRARGLILFYNDYPDEQSLNKDWHDYNNMTVQKRRISDWKSVELFGFTNKERYEKMLHKFILRDTTNRVSDENELHPKSSDGFTDVITAPVSEALLLHPTNVVEKVLSESAQENLINSIRNINRVSYGGTPFFSAPEMQYMGTSYSHSPRYSKNPVITSFNGEEPVQWWHKYQDTLNGWNGNTLSNYNDWKRMIKKLGDRLQSCNERQERLNIMQSMLDFGWNPAVTCTEENFRRATKRVSSIMEESVQHITLVDVSENVNERIVTEKTKERSSDGDEELYIGDEEKEDDSKKVPLFIIFYNSTTQFNKLTRIFDNSIYSHVGVSLTPSLSTIYSFTANRNGLMKEHVHSIHDAKTIEVYMAMISSKSRALIKKNIQMILQKHYQYSFLGLLSIPLKIDYISNGKMVCSQFADFVMKLGQIDISKIASNMVSPGDLHRAFKKRGNRSLIYKVYYGHPKNYSEDKVTSYMNALIKQMKTDNQSGVVKEYFSIQEAKDAPIQFDEDGNLLIDKGTNLDFEAEYAKCHLAMKQYEKANNIEGMKYGLCKLWYLNGLLEDKIHSDSDKTKLQKYYKVRAHILGDIHKYMAIVQKKEPGFDMLQEYENSPFADDKVRIRRSTLLYTIDLIKRMIGIKI